jgi:hypothetical protein
MPVLPVLPALLLVCLSVCSVEPDPSGTKETCILVFSAGAPYEDIAFRIINKVCVVKGWRDCKEGGSRLCGAAREQGLGVVTANHMCSNLYRLHCPIISQQTALTVSSFLTTTLHCCTPQEWEMTYRRGFKCRFDRGILQLYFNFRRARYRR